MQKIHTKFAQYIIQKYSADPNIIIVTPNQRLTNYLCQLVNQDNQTELQNSVCACPTILPFTNWLALLWKNIPNTANLLNSTQEYALWEKIIATTNIAEKPHLDLPTTQTVQNTIKAWNLIHGWQISWSQFHQYAFTHENKSFYVWASKYKEYLTQHNHCTLAEVSKLLTTLYHNNQKLTRQLVKNLLMIGFDDFSLTPQEKNLLEALNHSGCLIESLDPNQQVSQQQQLATLSPDDEISTMVNWAYTIHKREPQATIGCVVPKLHLCRDAIIRTFTETFVDPGEFIYDQSLPSSINISLGTSLDRYPLVSSALAILSLGQESLPLEDWHKILLSPFIQSNYANITTTTSAWEKIKTLNTLFPGNACSFNKIQSILNVFCKELCATIQQYKENLSSLLKQSQSAKNWLIFFNKQLQNFGWPGARKLNSGEYQTLIKWQKLGEEFSSLDLIYSHGLSYTKALAKLNELAQSTIFQPQTPDDNKSKINILGALEAGGLNFDYLWVTSMDDQSWPSPLTPNPFIPLKLQRKLNMPNASITRGLEFCRVMQQRWCRSAQHLVFSYAIQNNEQTSRPSPLLQHIQKTTKTELLTNSLNIKKVSELIHQLLNDKLEKYVDSTAPQVMPNEKIKGGTSILQSQVTCPFQAFANYRLNARTPMLPSTKIWRGNIVHRALEEIWQILKDQATLCNYSQNQSAQEKLITTAIDNAYIFVQQQDLEINNQSRSENFLRLEKAKLYSLLARWLDVEKEREPFTVIQTEQEIIITISGLLLRLRIDRIDQLADGKLVIIDYKTGKKIPAIKDCLATPPTAIQLPVYALGTHKQHKEIAALVFAHITSENFIPGSKLLVGLIDNDACLTNKKNNIKLTSTDMTATINQWQTSLSKVADDFMRGIALITPCKPDACRTCHLQLLCRIKTLCS